MKPLQHFSMFITTALLDTIVEQPNICSFQTIHKSIDINRAEIMSLIGMSIKMGILQLPCYKSYWSRELRSPVEEQIIPSKTKYSSTRQCNPKKPKK